MAAKQKKTCHVSNFVLMNSIKDSVIDLDKLTDI